MIAVCQIALTCPEKFCIHKRPHMSLADCCEPAAVIWAVCPPCVTEDDLRFHVIVNSPEMAKIIKRLEKMKKKVIDGYEETRIALLGDQTK